MRSPRLRWSHKRREALLISALVRVVAQRNELASRIGCMQPGGSTTSDDRGRW